MAMHRIVMMSSDLDRMGHHDLSDALDRVLAETRPAAQPQIQQLSPALTTMRGPAGWALLEDDEQEQEAELAKQVKERRPRKVRPRSSGLSVGVDVLLDSKRRTKSADQADK